jgi:hypothetical protein
VSQRIRESTYDLAEPDKPRILIGDTPTGRLHYVVSIENRLALRHAQYAAAPSASVFLL